MPSSSENTKQISEAEYGEFSKFLQDVSGITLGQNKQYLVTTRLRRLLIESQIADISTLIKKIKQPMNSALRQKVIDVMTTNETFWFRDGYPFDYLANTLIPQLSQENNHSKIKFWCAACSTGQEPYSISILFEEAKKKNSGRTRDAEILATDVSSSVLERAGRGEYDQISLLRGLSSERSNNFFQKVDDQHWGVKSEIKSRVRFRSFNLQDSFFSMGKFDIIFCRNVLIYFSPEFKVNILKKMHGVLNPGGILFLGSSESVAGLNDYFEMVHCNPGVAYRAKKTS